MPKTDYISDLDGEQIEAALEAVHGVITPANNGKVLCIVGGKIAAKSASEWGGGGYPEPTGTIPITENGTVNVKDYETAEVNVPNSYAAADEGKVVKNGELVAQTARATAITENGTYDTTENNEVTVNVSSSSAVVQPLSVTQNGTYNPPSGVAGYAPVTVNVSGGGSDLYPLWTDIYDNPMPTGVSVSTPTITAPSLTPSWIASSSQNVQNFVNNECRLSTKTSALGGSITIQITKAMAQRSLSQLIADESLFGKLAEYYGNLYGSALLTTYNMVLLGDFSQGGSTTGNVLTDAITNYSAVALQGIYRKERTSSYNTTIIYPLDLNTERWTGMKDRNNSYNCNVTFTDASTVSLSGTKQVIIYGIP